MPISSAVGHNKKRRASMNENEQVVSNDTNLSGVASQEVTYNSNEINANMSYQQPQAYMPVNNNQMSVPGYNQPMDQQYPATPVKKFNKKLLLLWLIPVGCFLGGFACLMINTIARASTEYYEPAFINNVLSIMHLLLWFLTLPSLVVVTIVFAIKVNK